MKKNKLFGITVFAMTAVLSAISCVKNNTGDETMTGSILTVNYNEIRQEIDGFGASDAWSTLPANEGTANEIVKLLFSKTEGAGLTILRNRIPFRERISGDDEPGLNDGFIVRKSDNTYDYTTDANGIKTFNLNWNNWDLSGTRNFISRIKALGADGPEQLTVMSSPWTPPNNRITRWKEDVAGVDPKLDGEINWSRPDIWGRLKREHFNDYADLLADYVKNFEARMGAPLAVLSIQNEPNMKVGYESAYWDGADIRDFLKVIGERFPGKGIALGAGGLGIMAPEYENYDVDFDALIKPSLDDPASRAVLTHIALHQYNASWDSTDRAGTKEFPGITSSGKRFWQTEVSTLSNPGQHEPPGEGIDNALFYARMIHFNMTLAQTNAFLYWWFWSSLTNSGGCLLTVNGNTVKPAARLFAMGQYSRFVRPGWSRIDATTRPAMGVFSSAYRNPAGTEIAVVLINNKFAEEKIIIEMTDKKFASLKAWRTSAEENLAALGDLALSNGRVQITLPPKSVTTVYGSVE